MLKSDISDGVIVCKFRHSDKLNSVNSDKFKREIGEYLTTPGTMLILDLDKIKFIDSSGFGALLFAHRLAGTNSCQLRFCNIYPAVLKSFKILQLDKVFTICRTPEECHNTFS